MTPPAAAMREPETLPQSRAEHDRMANAIRALAMDAVEQAKSGHPGLPMGAADIATVLFTQFLKFDPADPKWPDRDRFVLSAGHGSMLLYALLYLLGYEAMTIDQIKRFRQLGSLTPGHPENFDHAGRRDHHRPARPGPRQCGRHGDRRAASRGRVRRHRRSPHLRARLRRRPDGRHFSQEAIALAGHLKLNRLIVLFDDNGISIDGPLSLADSVDQVKRFEAAGWNASRIDGHDPQAIAAAIATAKKSDKPTMIACRTTIGFGAPTKAGKASSHGSPLGADEIKGAREKLGWTIAPFEIPADILNCVARRRAALEVRAQGLGRTARRAADGEARRVRAPHQWRSAARTGRRGARRQAEARRRAEGDRDAHRFARTRSTCSPPRCPK